MYVVVSTQKVTIGFFISILVGICQRVAKSQQHQNISYALQTAHLIQSLFGKDPGKKQVVSSEQGQHLC